MIQASMDYMRQLWDETPEHNWAALLGTLERHEERAKGISSAELDDALLNASRRLSHYGRPYPGSPQELHDLLNSEIASGPEHATGGVV